MMDYNNERRDENVCCHSISTASSNTSADPPPSDRCRLWCGLCTLRFILAITQCGLGLAVTCVGLYVASHTEGLRPRDTPYWAGLLLLLSGILSLYVCAADTGSSSAGTRAAVLKVSAGVVGAVAVFTSLVAAVFPAILLSRINFLQSCDSSTGSCTCLLLENDGRVLHRFEHEHYCHHVSVMLRTLLVVLSSFSAIGSLSCLWFVILLWKSKYS